MYRNIDPIKISSLGGELLAGRVKGRGRTCRKQMQSLIKIKQSLSVIRSVCIQTHAKTGSPTDTKFDMEISQTCGKNT